MQESERIKEAYVRRASSVSAEQYTVFNPVYRYITQRMEAVSLRALARHFDAASLRRARVLDAGCGNGAHALRFLSYGVPADNLHGIDLRDDAVQIAQDACPGAHFVIGNAESLPWPDASFSIVLQCTMFSSIFDPGMKRRIARELVRVLDTGGVILWYDFFVNNPANPDVRGIGDREIRTLFDGCAVSLERSILAPPLIRLLHGNEIICRSLEGLKFFNTHYVGVIHKAE